MLRKIKAKIRAEVAIRRDRQEKKKIERTKRRIFKAKRKEWLRWAKSLSNSPAALDCVISGIVDKGVMQSRLAQSLGRGDYEAVDMWVDLMETNFAKMIFSRSSDINETVEEREERTKKYLIANDLNSQSLDKIKKGAWRPIG